ncbi:MAG: hypothetical protein IJ806_11520 [Ruminococcus sp.]|nr:hypothetical protein [Ruminococcus sp.]MBR1864703.1 hypothetical protein [Ruminococcus sp.]
MACFLVPAAEAVVTTVVTKVIKKKEIRAGEDSALTVSDKLCWLNKMLWGGSGLLAFEHLWHGEISPFFPFLTAASSPESTAAMLHEMATSGTAMAALVTLVWAGLAGASKYLEKQASAAEGEES